MEKDLSQAAALRRAALSRGSISATSRPATRASIPKIADAAASASTEGAPLSAPPEPKAEPAKSRLKTAAKVPAKAAAKAPAKGATRQRQLKETRAQMLERLSNPLISLHEASVLLRVCSATVRRMSNDGELPHTRTPGGQRRFYLRDVMQVLAEREAEQRGSGRARARTVRNARAASSSSRTEPPSRKTDTALAREARERLDATRARLQAVRAPGSATAPRERESAPSSAAPAAARGRLPLRLGAVIARSAAHSQDETESTPPENRGKGDRAR